MSDVKSSMDELSGVPPDAQTRLARDLEASRVALREIAPLLWKARGYYLSGVGPQVDWIIAPREVRDQLIGIAERAVRSVLTQHRLDAERQAQLVYRAAVHGALRGILDTAIAFDPHQEHLVRRILGNAEQALISYTRDDIAGAIIRTYLDALVVPQVKTDGAE
jgi:hypothetical protein